MMDYFYKFYKIGTKSVITQYFLTMLTTMYMYMGHFEQANVTTAIDGKNESVNSPSRSSFHGKRSLRTHLSDDSGFVAFTTDYHPPRHHPPKNNK